MLISKQGDACPLLLQQQVKSNQTVYSNQEYINAN